MIDMETSIERVAALVAAIEAERGTSIEHTIVDLIVGVIRHEPRVTDRHRRAARGLLRAIGVTP